MSHSKPTGSPFEPDGEVYADSVFTEPLYTMPRSEIRLGFDYGIWSQLNAESGTFLDEYEGAVVEAERVSRFIEAGARLLDGLRGIKEPDGPAVVHLLTELLRCASAAQARGVDLIVNL